MNKKQEFPREVNKKVFSFFILAFPIMLMVLFSLIIPIKHIWWGVVLLAIFHFLMLKQFLDNYYGEDSK